MAARASSSATCRRASSGSASAQDGRAVAGRRDRAGGLRGLRLGACGTWPRAGPSTPPAPTPRPRGWPASGRGASSSASSSLMGALAGPGRAAERGPLRRTSTPTPATGLELQVIAAVVVGGTAISGGRGTLVGTADRRALLGTIGPALVFLGVAGRSGRRRSRARSSSLAVALRRAASAEERPSVTTAATTIATAARRRRRSCRAAVDPAGAARAGDRGLRRHRHQLPHAPATPSRSARLSVEIGLLALALTPVIVTGGIDLSVGSLMGLCGGALRHALARRRPADRPRRRR